MRSHHEPIRWLIALLLFFSAGAMTSRAHAAVQPSGTFVPARCGIADADAMPFGAAAREVCFGKVTSVTPEFGAIWIRLLDGSTDTFRVTNTASELIAYLDGSSKMMYFFEDAGGHKGMIKVTLSPEGEIVNGIGNVVDQFSYAVPQFQKVQITQ